MSRSKAKKHNVIRQNIHWIMLAIFFGAALLLTVAAYNPVIIEPDEGEILVYKRANCGCCQKWVEYMEENGFKVKVNTVASTAPIQNALNIPVSVRSCHTALIDDFWVEGHVPAKNIETLIEEAHKEVAGIAVPGMPPGSPGMESDNPQPYDVLMVQNSGEVSVMSP